MLREMEWKTREQEEMAGIGGHLRGFVQWKLPEILTVILMRIPSNRGYRVSAGYLLSPGEASSGRTGLHSIEFLAKGGGPHGNPQTTQVVTKNKGLLSRN